MCSHTYTCISATPLSFALIIHKKFFKILKAIKSFISAFFHLQTWKSYKIVAVAFWSKEEFLKRRGPPTSRDLFLTTLDPPLGRYGRNTSLHMRCHEHFIPTTFGKHASSGSVVKTDYLFHTYTCISAPPFLRLKEKKEEI